MRGRNSHDQLAGSGIVAGGNRVVLRGLCRQLYCCGNRRVRILDGHGERARGLHLVELADDNLILGAQRSRLILCKCVANGLQIDIALHLESCCIDRRSPALRSLAVNIAARAGNRQIRNDLDGVALCGSDDSDRQNHQHCQNHAENAFFHFVSLLPYSHDVTNGIGNTANTLVILYYIIRFPNCTVLFSKKINFSALMSRHICGKALLSVFFSPECTARAHLPPARDRRRPPSAAPSCR